jgi:hypothetical protein
VGDVSRRILNLSLQSVVAIFTKNEQNRDVEDFYPSLEVIGTDLIPLQPASVPPNSKFVIDDAENLWTYQRDGFELVHLRNLAGSIRSFENLYKQAFQAIAPDGWVEHFELDFPIRSATNNDSLPECHPLNAWVNALVQAGDQSGLTFRITQDGRMREQIQKAGFVDVVEKTWKVPIGDWPTDPTLKQVGRYSVEFLSQSMVDMALCADEVLGWGGAKTQTLVQNARSALKNEPSRLYYTAYVEPCQADDVVDANIRYH